MIKTILNIIGLTFTLSQYKWWRKLIGGRWYQIKVSHLGLGPFWTDTFNSSCGSVMLKREFYLN